MKNDFDALATALSAAREAALTGNISALAPLTEQIETMSAALNIQSADAAQMARLQQLAMQNTTLLTAARRGLQDAISRVKSIREGPKPFQTYDRAGARAPSLRSGKFEKRA